MGSFMSSCKCQRRNAALADFGIPSEYPWVGLPQDNIDEYYNAKASTQAALEEHAEEVGEGIDDSEWIRSVLEPAQEELKRKLLQRAIALVHALKPIEEQRKGIYSMQEKGFLPENHFESFTFADHTCQQELKSIIEESQSLVPEAPPNAFIQTAVQLYHRQLQQEQSREEEESNGQFETVKRGFLMNEKKTRHCTSENNCNDSGLENNANASCKCTSENHESDGAHGFKIGAEVEAHSLQTASLNGARGQVLGRKEERVAVTFPDPIGVKMLKPANLKLVPPSPKLFIHPDATEVPAVQFQVTFHRQAGERLGLALHHEPALEEQQPGTESCLLIKDILEDGLAKKFNDSQEDANMTLHEGDRILAVVDSSQPEDARTVVSGNSQDMLRVIGSGCASLTFMIVRILGPPLRFKLGQSVQANCGEKGWLDGCVIDVWKHAGVDVVAPYVIRLKETGDIVTAVRDSEEIVRKAPEDTDSNVQKQ